MENDANVKKISPLICNMSGIYEAMYPVETRVNMTDIQGTNCYCDDKAAELIKERLFLDRGDGGSMAGALGEGISAGTIYDDPFIRFLDSGNYHYLSFFFMERIKEDFALILIDNHTDMQPPGFGRILSCGGWVRYAMDELDTLKKVYLVGMSAEHLAEAGPLPDKACYLDHRRDLFIPDDLPIYLSIDKDVLSDVYAATDWDQGDMTLEELMAVTGRIFTDHRILGVDICGEKKEIPTDAEMEMNLAVNAKLLEAVSRYR